MAAAADIASTGSYFGDVGARSPSAALTERARQDIATADRLEAAGTITEDQHAIAIASAIARAPSASKTAVAPSGGGAASPSSRVRGYDGHLIKQDELDGICNQPPRGKVWCKTEWPGGFIGPRPDGSEPGPPWVPAKEEVSTVQLVDPRSGKVTVVTVSRLVPADDCFPNGKPWWVRGGAWAARAAIGTAEQAPAALAEAGQRIAAGVRRVIVGAPPPIDQTAPSPAPGPAAPPPAAACDAYRSLVWPGGIVCIPAGSPKPDGSWERV